MISGVKLHLPDRRDFSFDRLFEKKKPIAIKPLGRDLQAIPAIYQGNEPICVPCSLTWMALWFGHKGVDPQSLVKRLWIQEDGIRPGTALKYAKTLGWINSYSFLWDKSATNVYKALTLGPLMVVVDGIPTINTPHAMVLADVLEDGTWQCISWGTKDKPQIIGLSPDTKFIQVVSFATPPKKPAEPPTFSFFVFLLRCFEAVRKMR